MELEEKPFFKEVLHLMYGKLNCGHSLLYGSLLSIGLPPY